MRISSASPSFAAASPTATPAGKSAEKPLYDRFKDTVTVTAAASSGTTLGYAAGAAIGAAAYGLGGSGLYAVGAPAMGAMVGGMTAMAIQQNSKEWGNGAWTGASAGIGSVVGDAIGHGLTALTGNALYQSVGMAAGALNGAALAVNILTDDSKPVGKVAKYATPTLLGATSGVTLGVLTGALVSSVAGTNSYGTVAQVLGGLAGGLTGLAVAVNKPTH